MIENWIWFGLGIAVSVLIILAKSLFFDEIENRMRIVMEEQDE